MRIKPFLTPVASSRLTARRRTRSRAPLMESLEERVLLDGSPTGSLDVASRTMIAGWAWDSRVPNSTLNVQITIDGQSQTVAADTARADLTPVLGSADHGYTLATPTLTPGTHHVIVAALDPFTLKPVTIGSADITNPAPIGWVDAMNSTTISGWAFDSDAGSSAVQVQVTVNGTVTQTVTADNPRPDLQSILGSANHGFRISGTFNTTDVVEVLVLDNPSDAPVVVKSNDGLPTGSMDILDRAHVVGWAYDSNHPNDPINVRIEVDGATWHDTTFSANLTRSDLTPVIGSANHGYDVSLSDLPPGTHTVKVYAENPDSAVNTEMLIGQGTVTNPPPVGFIDVAGQTEVAGWAYDADAAATPITIKVKVDDVLKATVTADVNRPDLTPVIGSANHGYNVVLSGLAAGPHRIQVYGVDLPSGTDYLMATQVIDNTLPIGWLDVANLTNIAGWTVDPDSVGMASTVKLMIDGVDYGRATADITRNDLTASIGSADHGFSFSTPTLTFGTHTVQIYSFDTFTDQEQLIGNTTVTNHTPVGSLDVAQGSRLAGWAYDSDAGAAPIDILIARDDIIIGRVTAQGPRADLQSILGSSDHGYDVSVTPVAGSHLYKIYAVDPMGVTALIGQATLTA